MLRIGQITELQEQYESQVFAYQRLSELLTHQADLFASIVNRHRYFAPNFRVGFYGRGFPASVQNKQYVYRAYDWEKYGCARSYRLRRQYANENYADLSVRGCKPNIRKPDSSEVIRCPQSICRTVTRDTCSSLL